MKISSDIILTINEIDCVNKLRKGVKESKDEGAEMAG